MNRMTLALFLVALTSGCATGMGNIKSDDQLTAGVVQTNIYCITTDYAEAKNCALYSIIEFSEQLQATSQFDRATAFSLLGLGTIAAVATSFEFDEDVLKSAAIGTGIVAGVRSVVDSDIRRVVLEKGTRDMVCALRAAEAVGEANTAASSKSVATHSVSIHQKHIDNANAQNGETGDEDAANQKMGMAAAQRVLGNLGSGSLASNISNIETMIKADSPNINDTIAQYDSYRIAAALQRFNDEYADAKLAISSANGRRAEFLSSSVIEIRARVRAGLSGKINGIDDLAKTQSERIEALLGEIVRQSEEVDQEAGDSGVPKSGIFAEAILTSASELVEDTAGIREVYESCVGASK